MKFGYETSIHPEFGKKVICLYGLDEEGSRVVEMKFSPELGCNMFSLIHESVQYLFEKIEFKGNLMMLGSPVLYPSPNRIRNARFEFDGRKFEFEPNEGTNFLHGLLMTYVWKDEEPLITKDGISVKNSVSFTPGNDLYEKFPVANRLELTYTLKKDRVCLNFTVINEDKENRMPFGFGIHPYIKCIGKREEIRLQVPAKKWMEASDLLPSGKLVDLADGPGDMTSPKPLSELNLDDVFWGMEPDSPQIIYFDSIGKKLTFYASEILTHTCIFCPPHFPFFCVENQTCSADAHNLYAQGFQKESNLLILSPQESISGSIQIEIANQ